MLNKKNGKEKSREINVGSIEEDMEILKNIIEIYENCSVPEIDMQVDITFGKKEVNAIKTVLGNLEALCDMQRSADKELELLREKVKRLEEQVEYDKTHIYTPLTIQLNFIPKQKIEDKIEELKEENYQISLESKVVFDTGIMKNNLKIQVLQELLQESEDK